MVSLRDYSPKRKQKKDLLMQTISLSLIGLLSTGIGISFVLLPLLTKLEIVSKNNSKFIFRVGCNLVVLLSGTTSIFLGLKLKKTGKSLTIINQSEAELEASETAYSVEAITSLHEQEYQSLVMPVQFEQPISHQPTPHSPVISQNNEFHNQNEVSVGYEFQLPNKASIPTGELILEEASATSLSTVFSSPPGTGKTVTLLSWLKRLLVKFPDSLVTVVAQKNDSFMGLSSIGAVSLFDGIDTSPIEQNINEIFEILQFRKSQDEEIRKQFKTQPVWLILDDWFSIYDVISKDKKLWSQLSSKISTIVTVGREFNVAIAVTTHSFNIASLGLAKDSNIRSCLNIMSLGFISKDEYGRNQGGFDAINGILNNNSIISTEYREGLKIELERLIMLSGVSQTPVLFTTMGHPPRMALLPNLCEIKQQVIPQSILLAIKTKLDRMRGHTSLISTEQESRGSQTRQDVPVTEDIYDAVDKEDKKDLIMNLINQGITGKMEIIKQIWGVSSGRKYTEASQEYNQIMEIN